MVMNCQVFDVGKGYKNFHTKTYLHRLNSFDVKMSLGWVLK